MIKWHSVAMFLKAEAEKIRRELEEHAKVKGDNPATIVLGVSTLVLKKIADALEYGTNVLEPMTRDLTTSEFADIHGKPEIMTIYDAMAILIVYKHRALDIDLNERELQIYRAARQVLHSWVKLRENKIKLANDK